MTSFPIDLLAMVKVCGTAPDGMKFWQFESENAWLILYFNTNRNSMFGHGMWELYTYEGDLIFECKNTFDFDGIAKFLRNYL